MDTQSIYIDFGERGKNTWCADVDRSDLPRWKSRKNPDRCKLFGVKASLFFRRLSGPNKGEAQQGHWGTGRPDITGFSLIFFTQNIYKYTQS